MEVVDAVRRGVRLSKPDGCPDEIFTQIIQPCFQENPDDRPTFREIYRKLESLFPSRRISFSTYSPTTSPTTSAFSASPFVPPSPLSDSGGISVASLVAASSSSSPVAQSVPTDIAALVAEEVMASAQSFAALVPYASSTSVMTRPALLPTTTTTPTEPAQAVAESASPHTRQQSREMAAITGSPSPSPSNSSSFGSVAMAPGMGLSLSMLDLSSANKIDHRLDATSQSYDEAAWAAALSSWKAPASAPRKKSTPDAVSSSSSSKESKQDKKSKKSRARPRSAEAPLHSQMLFSALAEEAKAGGGGGLSSSTKGQRPAAPPPSSTPSRTKATKEAQYTAMMARGKKRSAATRALANSISGAGQLHAPPTPPPPRGTTPAEATTAQNEETPYHRIPQFMRNSLQLATRRKNQATAPPPGSTTEESTDAQSQAQALGRRRMGIADIDPYQLLRLSESVGGFTEEAQAASESSQYASSATSPVPPKRKDSKTRNRPTWGKSHKV
jgi:hypothetical protein